MRICTHSGDISRSGVTIRKENLVQIGLAINEFILWIVALLYIFKVKLLLSKDSQDISNIVKRYLTMTLINDVKVILVIFI